MNTSNINTRLQYMGNGVAWSKYLICLVLILTSLFYAELSSPADVSDKKASSGSLESIHASISDGLVSLNASNVNILQVLSTLAKVTGTPITVTGATSGAVVDERMNTSISLDSKTPTDTRNVLSNLMADVGLRFEGNVFENIQPQAVWQIAPITMGAASVDVNKLVPDVAAQMMSAPLDKLFRVIVGLKKGVDAANLMKRRDSKGLADIKNDVQRKQEVVLANRRHGFLGVINRYKALHGFSAIASREAIEDLTTMPEVVSIEEMPIFYKQDLEANSLTGVDIVNSNGLTGQGITIAVIDDGIDHDHAAFGGNASWPNAKILGGWDYADNDGDPRIDCVQQTHGTSASSVALGNGGGVNGTAPNAKLVFLKVQAASECGAHSLSGDVVGAIDWVINNKDVFDIRIISMSLGGGGIGGPGYSSAVTCAAAHPFYSFTTSQAANAGLILFAASGNDGLTAEITNPACQADVISVGAVYDKNIGSRSYGPIENILCQDQATAADQVTCYSNSATILDILAPSDCATAAWADGGVNQCFNGTSSATPFAAGVALSC